MDRVLSVPSSGPPRHTGRRVSRWIDRFAGGSFMRQSLSVHGIFYWIVYAGSRCRLCTALYWCPYRDLIFDFAVTVVVDIAVALVALLRIIWFGTLVRSGIMTMMTMCSCSVFFSTETVRSLTHEHTRKRVATSKKSYKTKPIL